jgi:uncharacterized membrane protein HdeD (DUF308 family)
MAATNVLLSELENLHHKWGWILVLGIVLICLGVIALLMTPVSTVAAVLVLGWLVVASGVIEIVHAFRVHRWGGMFLHLVGGIVGILIGLLIVTNPVAGALVWTLLFASFFCVIGIFHIVTALRLKFANWGWAVFDGVITLGLGILVWAHWPWSGLWFLGISLGVALVLRGWSYVMLALAVRNIPVSRQILRAA